jgi:hypothetical protein
MLLCHAGATRGQSGDVAACSGLEAVASLGADSAPAYPPFEVVPGARPAPATLLLERALTELFFYPSPPRDGDGDGAGSGRLIAAGARSGAVLWDSNWAGGEVLPAPLKHAPVVLANAEGLAYRAYFGDGAGVVWRLDLPPGPTAGWQLRRLADLQGLATVAGKVAIPVEPDVFRAVDGAGRPFDGLVLSVLVSNEDERRIDLVLLRDYAVDGAALEETLENSDLVAVRSCDTPACPPAAGPGWYLADAAAGDALAVAPLIDGGRIFLATHNRLSLDCDRASAERFVVIVDLESGEAVYPAAGSGTFSLGRQVLDGPRPAGGVIHLPGLAEVLAEQGVEESVLIAQGLAVKRRYWLDLLLDSD